MLDYKDYQKIGELRESNPEVYELIIKISDYALETASLGCHDLRNHAALISSYCQLLTMTSPALTQNSYFEKVESSTKNLLTLFDEIALFRYSFKNNSLTTVSLNNLIQDAIKKIHAQFTHLTISFLCPDTIPDDKATFTCDFLHMVEALCAILKNSVEACNQDFIQITIHSKIAENSVILDITDTGRGFSDEMLKNACKPFITEKKNHSGLGLALAKTVLNKHNGDLTLSNTDTGAKVTITLHTDSV